MVTIWESHSKDFWLRDFFLGNFIRYCNAWTTDHGFFLEYDGDNDTAEFFLVYLAYL